MYVQLNKVWNGYPVGRILNVPAGVADVLLNMRKVATEVKEDKPRKRSK